MIAALFVAAGCAELDRRPERSPQADGIPVFENVIQTTRPYTTIERIWTGTGKSALVVPTYDSIEDGRRDLQQQAVNHGGDAVMNFTCYRRDATIPMEQSPRLYCVGAVVKFL